MSEDGDRYYIRSLARGMAVLRVLSDRGAPTSLSEIAVQASIPLPTAFRVVRTLVGAGFLEAFEDGTYGLGVGAVRLGLAAMANMDLVRVAEPHLRRLAAGTSETVNLGILNDVEVLYLVRIRNADLVTADIHVGTSLPAAASSMGKVLLASLSTDAVGGRLDRIDYEYAQGPNALRTAREFQQQLNDVRARGWASQDEELAYGLRSVSAPVRDHHGATSAAVNIAVSAGRWPLNRMVDVLLPALRETCDEISFALGMPRESRVGSPPGGDRESD